MIEYLTPEMTEVLRAGAANAQGMCCTPGQVRKLWPVLRDAEKLGYVRIIGSERPWITPQGRRAIGAPSESEADRLRLIALCGGRKRLEPSVEQDPRTDFDYRSYRSMGWVCTLVVRQPDSRERPLTLRVGRDIDSEPQFLGSRNSIVQPESEGTPFVLTLVPAWMTKPMRRDGILTPPIFSTYPFALDEHDARFSAEDRETWERLRRACYAINTRIRRGKSAPTPTKRVFGETA